MNDLANTQFARNEGIIVTQIKGVALHRKEYARGDKQHGKDDPDHEIDDDRHGKIFSVILRGRKHDVEKA